MLKKFFKNLSRFSIIHIEYNEINALVFELFYIEYYSKKVNINSCLFGFGLAKDFLYVDFLYFKKLIYSEINW